MIQTAHYCTHVIEQFTSSVFTYIGPTQRNGITNDERREALNLLSHEIAKLLHRAEKFVLPDWGRIFDGEEMKVLDEQPTLNRLPYPVIACEYSCDYGGDFSRLGKDEVISSRRIALAVETDVLPGLSPYLNTVMNVAPTPGIMVFPVFWFDQQKLWAPPPCAGWLDRNERPQDMKATPIVSPLGLDTYTQYPEPEIFHRMAADIADEVIATCHLMLALGMERASMTTIPAPAKLNKKRERSGKPQMFEYKVLDIVADILAAPSESVGRPHGTHASPRMHKRRGHVRRLASGKATWVRNTIVGRPGRGEIRKDYTVHK